MRICHVEIENFRNFRKLVLDLGDHAVIVGENKIGKSNLIYALRLVLDPRLSDAERQLRLEDFWDGLPRPLSKNDAIRISIDLTGFENDENLMAVLAEHLVQAQPMISRFTYLYRPIPSLTRPPRKEADYEYIVFGGDRPESLIGYETRQWIPLTLLPALRNAEEDLANWRQSPLAPLLREVSANIDPDALKKVADKVSNATSAVAKLQEINTLSELIRTSLQQTVGKSHAVDTALGFSPTEPDRLLRSLRLFIDGGKRSIGDASLGSANLIYLTLLSLNLKHQVENNSRYHTFLAIEEPESHLHPHVQRLIFRDFLKMRFSSTTALPAPRPETVLLTTHSPHIVSVAPLKSIVVLHKSDDGLSTVGVSTANLGLDDSTISDLERYLDVSRGEIVFAKGVLLVEGPAEEFIIPVLARLRGYDFDQLGVTVCSVDGTNFAPYVLFLGKDGLNIPYAVLTDKDPVAKNKTLGNQRVGELLKIIDSKFAAKTISTANMLSEAQKRGIFLNDHTLEIDLFRCGQHQVMCNTLIELTPNKAAVSRALEWRDKPGTMDPKEFLKDIEAIGKGRYAQRLASSITGKACPDYIVKAIKYVVKRLR